MRIAVRLALLAVLAALPASGQQPPAPAVDVTIDTGAAGAVIDRHIYGQFAEH
ncbi:MAG: hypothetical protein JO256_10865, partial [Alphaproteobacteria bacterium]|nr:hypothetical protein [Alphaproteobacteria bacterium]